MRLRGLRRLWFRQPGGPFAARGGPRFDLGASFVWLLFILFPLIDAIAKKGPAVSHALTIAGAAAFVAAYVLLVLEWNHSRDGDWRSWSLFACLLAISTALTVGEQASWGFLFTYCAACTALIAPAPLARLGVASCVGFGAAATVIGGGSGGTAIGVVASTAGIGLLMTLFRDLRVRNAELSEARAELARMAVAEERERFARDLHDLLGHTLSVIAMKAELAGRLLPHRPEQAADEMAEVETVARQALGEVREAVSGYRQPTLEGELAGARMALTAAGIETTIESDSVELDPAVEGVLAWAVREGATNVIRHSGASHCSVRIAGGPESASVEIVDDGTGPVADDGSGHGLAGLAERAQTVAGRVESGSLSQGGFRLAVRVPSAPQPAPEPTPVSTT